MKPWHYILLVTIAVAVAVGVGFALREFFTRPDAEMWWKVIVGVCIVGFVGMLAYATAGWLRRRGKPEPVAKEKRSKR